MKNSVVVLGVRISNQTIDEAVETLECFIRDKSRVANAVSIVNAHTLNLAYEDPSYSAALNRSAVVFGDGTGCSLGCEIEISRDAR